MSRRRHHALLEIHAHCTVCIWQQRSQNAKGLAAQHHDKTGHVVDVVEITQTTYGVDGPGQAPAPAPLPRETLFK